MLQLFDTEAEWQSHVECMHQLTLTVSMLLYLAVLHKDVRLRGPESMSSALPLTTAVISC